MVLNFLQEFENSSTQWTIFFAETASIEIKTTTDFVVERNNISLFCNSSGKPKPSITWTRVGSSEVLSKTSILTVVNVSRPVTPDNVIQYQCSGDNGVGIPAMAVANITVLCKYVLLVPVLSFILDSWWLIQYSQNC